MMDEFVFFQKFSLILIVLAITLVIAMYSTLAERKIAAFLQERVGPNRSGPLGLLQPLMDGIKMFFKEDFYPTKSDRFLFTLGPFIAIFTACISSAVIPWGGDLALFGMVIPLQVTDVNVGLLYIFGVISLGVYGIMIGGWASNNKYSLMGSIRAVSQNISYEIGLGLSIIALVVVTESLSLREIAIQQAGFHWNIFYQPLGFLIFIICAFAECNRTPFDLPECETELVGGYHTEYSSMKLGFFLFAEYINMFISSAVMVTLYFGAYDIPYIELLGLSHNIQVALGVLAFFIKVFCFIFFFIWIRWSIPRFRYDQLMKFGWQILIPLALINIFFTALINLL